MRMILEPVGVRAVRKLPELRLRAAAVDAIDFALEGDGCDYQQRPRARYFVHHVDQRSRLGFAARKPDRDPGDGEAGLDRDPIAEGKVAGVGGGAGLEAVRDDRVDTLV